MSSALIPIHEPDELDVIREARRAYVRKALQPDVHYGFSDEGKFILYKSGAKRLLDGFGLRERPVRVEQEVDHDAYRTVMITRWKSMGANEPGKYKRDQLIADHPERFRMMHIGDSWVFQEGTMEEWTSEGLYRYVMKVELYRADNELVSEGMAVCTTLEPGFCEFPRQHENTVMQVATNRALNRALDSLFGLADMFETQPATSLVSASHQVGDPQPAATQQVDSLPGADPAARPRVVSFHPVRIFGYTFAKKDWKPPTDSMWLRPPSENQIGTLTQRRNLIGAELREFADAAILSACGVPEELWNTMAAASLIITFLGAVKNMAEPRRLFVAELQIRARASASAREEKA